MERKIIFKDTITGEELVMPVTPAGYEIEHGRQIETLTMHQIGDISLPGGSVLINTEQEFLLPAHAYPFCVPGANTNPFVYLEKLERWADAGRVLRYIVAGTPVNAAVYLGPIRYREQDGTNDIYVTVPIRGKRQLAAETMEAQSNGNAGRAVETQPATQRSYTVVAGDTLSGIARRFYGNAGLYGKLAAANSIVNPHLIHPGQVLTLPDVGSLPAAKEPGRSEKIASATKVTYDNTEKQMKMQFKKEEAAL